MTPATHVPFNLTFQERCIGFTSQLSSLLNGIKHLPDDLLRVRTAKGRRCLFWGVARRHDERRVIEMQVVQ